MRSQKRVSGNQPLGFVHTYSFLFESGAYIFSPVHTDPVETVTENASFQNCSPGWRVFKTPICRTRVDGSSVGAARAVSPNWSQETMKCHSSSCFSIASVQGNAPLVTSLRWMDENGGF